MKKCFYLLTILGLLLQPGLASLYGASAQVGGDEPHAPAAVTLFVKPAPTGTGICDSWANACGLQTALGTATSGDEIWAQAGIYKPTTGTDRTVSFVLMSGVAIYGGFAGTETSREQRNWATNVTTLSGDIGAVGDNSDNSYHVVTGSGVDGTAILDGFTITLGNANASYVYGGGMYNWDSSPTITNVTFSGNTAGWGGGMYNLNNSSPTLANVTFSGNTAGEDGGGMYNLNNSNPALANVIFSGNTVTDHGGGMFNDTSSPSLVNVTFSGNTAYYGGGMYNYASSSPTITNVTFSGNTASFGGGGMFNDTNSSPQLTGVTFSGNTAFQNGGGMLNNSSPDLVNVTFSGNTASFGGGMYNYNNSIPALANVTFSGNTATNYGGGMFNVSSSPALANVTFSGNMAGSTGGGMYNYINSSPALANAILWGNTPDQIFNDGSTPVVSYSDIQGGYSGVGNINANPQFVNAAGGNLRLQLSSPAIDAGNNAAVPAGITTDRQGLLRFVDIVSVPNTGSGAAPIVDMGAYEAQNIVCLPLVRR